MNTTKISTQGENDDKYHKSYENVEKQIEDYRCRKYNAKLKYGSVCLEFHILLNVSVPDDKKDAAPVSLYK